MVALGAASLGDAGSEYRFDGGPIAKFLCLVVRADMVKALTPE